MRFLRRNQEMPKASRFLYLNLYSLLLLLCGILAAAAPVHRVSRPLVVPQAALALLCVTKAVQLLSAWNDKKLKYKILMGRNKDEFRPDTFADFMQFPCGRLLTKAVLRDLGLRGKYKDLLVYRKSCTASARESCKRQETKIHINGEAL